MIALPLWSVLLFAGVVVGRWLCRRGVAPAVAAGCCRLCFGCCIPFGPDLGVCLRGALLVLY